MHNCEVRKALSKQEMNAMSSSRSKHTVETESQVVLIAQYRSYFMGNNIFLYQAGVEDLETSWGEVAIMEAVAILAEVSSVPVRWASDPNRIGGGNLLCKLKFLDKPLGSWAQNVERLSVC